GRGARQGHRVAGGGKGEGGDDDLVTRTDAGCQQAQVEAGGAGVHGDGRAPVHHDLGEFLLKGGHLGALGQHSGGHDGVDRCPLLRADDRFCCGDEVLAHALSSAVFVSASVREVSFREFVSSRYFAPVSGHTQTPPSSFSGKPALPTQPSRRAGTPAMRANAGTSFVTTEPAAIVAQRPMVSGAMHTARAPTEAPSSMVTPTGVQSWALLSEPSGLTARG